ncbi:Peptidase A1 domain-containing protein [Aphelenchoides bicaudatus]|nr:Peptidase A1 domain-containing protein [Aphelenchoides bicaudatus]
MDRPAFVPLPETVFDQPVGFQYVGVNYCGLHVMRSKKWPGIEADRSIQLHVSRKHVPQKHARRGHNGITMRDFYGAPISSAFFNVEYKAMISVDLTFCGFPHKGCQNTGDPATTLHCPNTQVYDETASSTYKATPDNFKITYGIGSTEGKYAKDVFAFGNDTLFQLKNPITFGWGDKTVDGDTGVLGLSFSFKNEKGTSIFQQLLDERKLDHPIFTVFYKRCPPNINECGDGGTITLGKHDRKNCGPILGWTPPIDPKNFLWQFEVESLVVNGYTAPNKAQAITDTGTSHIRVAKSVYQAIIKEVKGVEAAPGSNLYKVPCANKFEIKLKINGIEYVINWEALIVELANDECQLQIADREENEVWILGDPFIRSYCHIHDWTARKVGFAKPGENLPGEEYTPPPPVGKPTVAPVTRRTPPTVIIEPRTIAPPAAPCKDTSRSCFNWNRNGFCSMAFYDEAKKRELCALTCNLCPVANTVNNARRRARPRRNRHQPARGRQNTRPRQAPARAPARARPVARPRPVAPRNNSRARQAQVAARRAQAAKRIQNARVAAAQRARQVHHH